jgi:hypothetical protein
MKLNLDSGAPLLEKRRGNFTFLTFISNLKKTKKPAFSRGSF